MKYHKPGSSVMTMTEDPGFVLVWLRFLRFARRENPRTGYLGE